MRGLLRRLGRPWTVGGLAAGAALCALAVQADLFEIVYEVTRTYEAWDLDELFSMLMVLSLLIPLLLLRWNRSLVSAHRLTSQAEAEAWRIAFHDPLTGLPNRRSFHRHVAEVTDRPERLPLVVLLLDLDRFKPVNDLRGHEAGDLLLVRVANRLRSVCPRGALVARLGGDEFVVAIDGPEAEDQGAALARRVNAALAAPFDFGDWSALLSCSIGIAAWSKGMTPGDLLRQADQAMYRAKQAGRNAHIHYDGTLGETMREQAALEQDLRRALDSGAIVPHFQPIFDIASRGLRGIEVLARWPDPARGFVPPEVFVPLAEELGLIDRLSDLVLDQACAALVRWPTGLPLSFNLSPRQFADPGLARRVLAVLERHGLDGSRFEIEITEQAVMADLERARAIVAEFVAAGVRVSLDDFGTGASSLAMLTSLPIGRIKIDRSFIAEVDRQPQRAKLVSGVLALAESLGLEVTAEGIERGEELAFLRARNCTLGQGYLLGRPQDAEAIGALFEALAPCRPAPRGAVG